MLLKQRIHWNEHTITHQTTITMRLMVIESSPEKDRSRSPVRAAAYLKDAWAAEEAAKEEGAAEEAAKEEGAADIHFEKDRSRSPVRAAAALKEAWAAEEATKEEEGAAEEAAKEEGAADIHFEKDPSRSPVRAAAAMPPTPPYIEPPVKEEASHHPVGLLGLGELWVGGNSPGCAEGAVKEEVVDIADCCPLPTEELNRENLSIDDLQNFTTQLPPEAINREIVYVVEKRGSAYTPEERMTIIDAQDHAAMPLFRKQWRP